MIFGDEDLIEIRKTFRNSHTMARGLGLLILLLLQLVLLLLLLLLELVLLVLLELLVLLLILQWLEAWGC